MIENKTVFITGGAGFIGSTLAERLVERNRVVLFDNLARNSLKDKAFRSHKHLKLVEGDILDYESLVREMQGADIVVTGRVTDASLVVALIRQAEDQAITWHHRWEEAVLAGDDETTQVSRRELGAWEATVRQLREALRHLVSRYLGQ